jgi:hypothetical protein
MVVKIVFGGLSLSSGSTTCLHGDIIILQVNHYFWKIIYEKPGFLISQHIGAVAVGFVRLTPLRE